MSRKATVLVLASTGLAWLLQLLAARPGWMSEDSVDMWSQAVGNRPYNDLHTPLLSWLWSFLLPAHIGPLGPLLIHLAVFWVSVGALGLLVGRSRPWIGVLLPWVLLAVPQLWVLGYAWKDAALMACLTAATALWAWLVHGRPSPGSRWLLALPVLIGAALGAGALVRWYLLPGVLFLALGMALLIVVPHGRRPAWIMAASLSATVVLGLAVQTAVIQPEKSQNATTAFMYDLARLQCKGSPGVTVPPQLVIAGTAPFCDRISADSITTLFFPLDPATQKLRWPADADVAVVRDAWLNAARSHSTDLLEVKVEYLMWSLLLRPETYLQPLGNAEQSTLFSSADGSVGIGETLGFPSHGGVFTLLGTVPQSITIGLVFPGTVMSPIWFVIVLPLIAWLWRRRRWRDAARWTVVLASGVGFVVNFAIISLNAATRLTAPFVVLALLVSVLAATLPGLVTAESASGSSQDPPASHPDVQPVHP